MFVADLGELISRQSFEESEKRKHDAVEEAVNETWEAAHKIKKQAIEETEIKAKTAHEKVIRKINKQHERTLRVSLTEGKS